jgi:fibronectin type 3 domain-containing protein
MMEMIMNKKRLSYLLSILLLTILITSPVLIVGAAPPYQGETEDELTNDLTNQYVDPEGDNPTPLTDGTFTYLEPPYFSDDGNSLHNANLPRLLIADPNPDMQDLRFPQDPDVAAAIAGTRSTGATFTINYKASGTKDPWDTPCSTFPTSARTAFAAAAAIWASQIQSSVPITISACWTSTLPTGVLGYSGGGSWHRDFSGAPRANTWYQAALANSLAGSDLDPAYYDMYITYSSSFNWYYGTDGNTPSGQYDLVSVAAHEIAHGLHFAGMMEYSGGQARYGWGSGYPSIYETFMESGGGIKLISYTNPSTALGTLVTSNNLWWNGTNANAANGGGRVKMYAPSTWSSGSSYSHLDYTTFAGTINSLMVYAIGSGTSQHNPGPVTMGILKDMGWKTGTPPPPPTGVSASDGAFTDKVRVSWGGSGSFDYKIFLPLILKGGSGPTPEAPYFQVYRNTTNSSAGAIKLIDYHPASPYDDTSAGAGTTYYYWVKACNSAGCSDFSASDSGYRTGAVTIPSPPTGVSASDGTFTDKVQVSWSASAGATYYQVFRHTTNNSASAISLTNSHPSSPYDDTSAVAGTTYYYWVKACNSAGCSGFSASDSGYRAAEVTTPSPPTGVSASDGTYTDKVQVSWTASAGATYYQVFRYTSNNSSSATSLTSSHSSSPYDDTSAAAGTTYYYWVKACNSAGCSGFSASDSGYRATEVTTPSPPTGVSASDGTYTDKVQVSWAASAGATYYQVFRNTTNSSAGATSLTSSHSSSPYNDTSAVAGTTYYYWVKACNSAGCSGFSASDSGYRATSTIANGDFEAGHDGSWTEYSYKGWDLILHADNLPLPPHGGQWAVWLGGDSNETARISQSVTISSSQPYLHFWIWIASEDTCGNDYFYLKINGTNVAYANLCQDNNTGGWGSVVWDLSPYSEQTITLMFEVTTNSSLNSNLFLDDVSLSSSSTAATSDPIQGEVILDVSMDKHQFEGLK